MTFSASYWKLFNFLVRRVVAAGFIIVGLIVSYFGVNDLIAENPRQTDHVVRWITVLMPLLVVALGVLLARTTPYVPSGKDGIKRTVEDSEDAT